MLSYYANIVPFDSTKKIYRKIWFVENFTDKFGAKLIRARGRWNWTEETLQIRKCKVFLLFGTIHALGLGGEGSKICQIYRRIVLKNCRRSKKCEKLPTS